MVLIVASLALSSVRSVVFQLSGENPLVVLEVFLPLFYFAVAVVSVSQAIP